MAGKTSGKSPKVAKKPPARVIGGRIQGLPDWRGEVLSRIRRLIRQADPEMVEEVKWRKPSNSMAGVPAWSHDGMICTGETYKDKVKLTFARGASIDDPAGLFNASLGGSARRAIDIHQGDDIDARAFKSLIRAAAALNASSRRMTGKGKRSSRTKVRGPMAAAKPKLLSGGNPQIAKGDGDAPVRAYIEAMPGWKRDVGRRLDALVVRNAPDVRKAVRWNSPFYGVDGQGWFLSFHCMTRYIKVAFFRGASFRPIPPVESSHEDVRYLHIHEDDEIDEELVASWIRQASELHGEHLF
jgi:hypothetical protein